MVVVNAEYLQGMKLKEKVPIVNCVNENNITKKKSFVPAILVGQEAMGVDGKKDNSMEQLEWLEALVLTI